MNPRPNEAPPKLDALEMLQKLPQDCSFEDIHYHLYVLEKVQRGAESGGSGRNAQPARSGSGAPLLAVQVVWSREALKDVKEIAGYIRRDSPFYAQIVTDKIPGGDPQYSVLSRGAASMVPEIGSPRFRERAVYSYRVIYRLSEDSSDRSRGAACQAPARSSRKSISRRRLIVLRLPSAFEGRETRLVSEAPNDGDAAAGPGVGHASAGGERLVFLALVEDQQVAGVETQLRQVIAELDQPFVERIRPAVAPDFELDGDPFDRRLRAAASAGGGRPFRCRRRIPGR